MAFRFTLLCLLLACRVIAQRSPGQIRSHIASSLERNHYDSVGVYLSDLAEFYSNQKQYDSAIIYFRKALIFNEAHQLTHAIAANHHDLGAIHSSLDQLDSAIYYYTKALQEYTVLQDTLHIPIVQTNLGTAYKEKGLFDRSLEVTFSALASIENNPPDRLLAKCYTNIGNVYTRIGDLQKALEYHYKSLNVQHAVAYNKGIGQSYNNIGTVYNQLNQYDSAISNYTKALRIKRETKDTKGIGSTLNNIGNILIRQGKLTEAEPYLSEALQNRLTTKDLVGEAITRNNLGDLYLLKKDYHRAEASLLTAEKLIRQVGMLLQLKENLEIKVRLYKARSDYATSLKLAEELLTIKDSILNIDKAESLAEMQVRYETEKKEQHILLLEQETKLHQAEIKSNQVWLWAQGITIGLSVIIIGLVYNNFRTTRRDQRKVEMLLKELHHRVKNNLQLLSSVISLQSQQLTDENAIQAVKSSEGRINAMALIHRKLYSDQDNRSINIKDYLTELIGYLVYSYGYQDKQLKLNLSIQEIEIDVDKAIPLGLIMNELISNAFKYAYPDHAAPVLTIDLCLQNKHDIQVMICDNGKGIDIKQKGSEAAFGVKMVKALTKDLKGNLILSTENGTIYTLTIPLA